MRFKISFFALILFFCLACPSGPRQSADEVSFIILQMNDVYEIAPLEGGKAGGLARVAQVREELLAENPNVITVLSGDFLSPSFMGTLKLPNGEKIAGLQMIETLNALGLDYVTFGNHEFDISDPDLLQKRIDQSEFEWTVCNALRVKNGENEPFTQKGEAIPEYIIREINSPLGTTLKLGFLGVVLPFNKADYVHYLPVEETFRTTFAKMKNEADLVFGITHLEIEEDLTLAAKVPGIPLFLGGHDHVNMNRMAGKTRITKADANAKTVYIHRISHNLQTGKTLISSSLKKIDDTIAEEVNTKAVVERWQNSTNTIMKAMGYQPDKVLMETKEVLECKEAFVRTRQTNYGTLTVKAMEAAWPGADVYLINSGSMRLDDDISGVVTEYDVLRTFPFGGSIQQIQVQGADLKKILDIGLEKNIGEGGFFQISKVKKKNNNWQVNGKPINFSASYVVVLPVFLDSYRGDNIEFMKGFKAEKRENLTMGGTTLRNDIRDIVISYMQGL